MIDNFDDIRPYNDREAQEVFNRVSRDPLFQVLIEHFYPKTSFEQKAQEFRELKSILEFHIKFAHHISRSLLAMTGNEVRLEGAGLLSHEKAYGFISNHRDIVMDAVILQTYLYESIQQLMEISFGSNLMISPFLVDLGKLCKMYKTDRGNTQRELLQKSIRLSQYLKHINVDKNTSFWIAQRNGRTKNGIDKTDQGVVKMLSLNDRHNLVEHFSKLNITPIAVSYQYEPCDYLKVRELYLKQKFGVYHKTPNEDYFSIIYGIMQYKGNICLRITPPITIETIQMLPTNEADLCTSFTQIIDQQIFNAYQLWDTNYMAYDLLKKGQKYADYYTKEQFIEFKRYIREQLNKVKDIDDYETLERMFLELYANPVITSGAPYGHLG
ncbi:MAG: hypothetical protein LBC84_01275 [Prevotellaceae bacterium]|jgi:hypothetical protein|nr:hypothetical protein [Prevotellaceae bacterium]